jgi:NodT family efflux transporter outer membrane factor (OMF) lipoprotein
LGHAWTRPAPLLALGALAVTALAMALEGCAVGPDFHRPAPPDTAGYLHASAAAAPTGGQPAPAQPETRDLQQLQLGAELAGQWWQLFHATELDAVVRTALNHSPTLMAANATLAQAREQVNVARAALLPSVGFTAAAQRASGGAGLYSVGLAASYSADIFGGVRRNIEQQQAIAEYQRDELGAAYLTLTGEVVNEVLTISSTRLQIVTINDLIGIDRKNLLLAQREFAVGIGTRADVLTADAQLAADLTQLPELQKQLEQAYDQLSVLAGEAPGRWRVAPFDLQQFTLPRQLPVSLPSQLVRQRPDVLAAESQLHAASAAIGVAVAQEFPDITLSGSLTRQALQAADLFHQFDTLWGVNGALTQPIFKGGALRAQVRAARDVFTAQAASYRSVVLEALGQVADDLWGLQYDATLLTVDRHAVDVASEALQLQQQSYTVGTTNVLSLITAQRTYAQARLGYVSAQVQQFEDTAGLLVALGGAWWNAPGGLSAGAAVTAGPRAVSGR